MLDGTTGKEVPKIGPKYAEVVPKIHFPSKKKTTGKNRHDGINQNYVVFWLKVSLQPQDLQST
jgi:hypothetical protein